MNLERFFLRLLHLRSMLHLASRCVLVLQVKYLLFLLVFGTKWYVASSNEWHEVRQGDKWNIILDNYNNKLS